MKDTFFLFRYRMSGRWSEKPKMESSSLHYASCRQSTGCVPVSATLHQSTGVMATNGFVRGQLSSQPGVELFYPGHAVMPTGGQESQFWHDGRRLEPDFQTGGGVNMAGPQPLLA